MFWLGLLIGTLVGPWVILAIVGFCIQYEDTINNWYERLVKWWYNVYIPEPTVEEG